MTYLNSLKKTARFGAFMFTAGFAMTLLAWATALPILYAVDSIFWLIRMIGFGIFVLSPLLALPHYALSRRWSA
jgi:hypothetical protein